MTGLAKRRKVDGQILFCGLDDRADLVKERSTNISLFLRNGRRDDVMKVERSSGMSEADMDGIISKTEIAARMSLVKISALDMAVVNTGTCADFCSIVDESLSAKSTFLFLIVSRFFLRR